MSMLNHIKKKVDFKLIVVRRWFSLSTSVPSNPETEPAPPH